MTITIKLFAMFRTGRFSVERRELPAGTDCRTIVLDLNLTEAEIGIVLVNGRHVTLDHVPDDGDTLSLFPLVGGG